MILGVDPGVRTLGWAVVDSLGYVVDLGDLLQEADPRAGVTEDRARRTYRASETLVSVLRQYHCRELIAEAMSFPRKARVQGVVAGALPWGALCGIAAACGARLHHVRPQTWQRAVLPNKQGEDDYERVKAKLVAYVHRRGAPIARAALEAIPPSRRSHALDAVGCAVFAVVSSRATCISDPPMPRPRRARAPSKGAKRLKIGAPIVSEC